jgi:hypothetical protein
MREVDGGSENSTNVEFLEKDSGRLIDGQELDVLIEDINSDKLIKNKETKIVKPIKEDEIDKSEEICNDDGNDNVEFMEEKVSNGLIEDKEDFTRELMNNILQVSKYLKKEKYSKKLEVNIEQYDLDSKKNQLSAKQRIHDQVISNNPKKNEQKDRNKDDNYQNEDLGQDQLIEESFWNTHVVSKCPKKKEKKKRSVKVLYDTHHQEDTKQDQSIEDPAINIQPIPKTLLKYNKRKQLKKILDGTHRQQELNSEDSNTTSDVPPVSKNVRNKMGRKQSNKTMKMS